MKRLKLLFLILFLCLIPTTMLWLEVIADNTNLPPVWVDTVPSSLTVELNHFLQFKLIAEDPEVPGDYKSGGDSDGLTITLKSGKPSPYLSTWFDRDYNTMVVGWSPVYYEIPGQYTLTFEASDGVNNVTREITITLVETDQSKYKIIGKGCTTAFFIDKDCDGYGVASQRGTDADDNDPAINTRESAESYYGNLDIEANMRSFLQNVKNHIANNVYYVHNLAEWDSIANTLLPGDAVIFHEGDYNRKYALGLSRSGTEADPILLLAFPGESVKINAGNLGESVAGNSIGLSANYGIIDGFILDNPNNGGEGIGVAVSAGASNNIIRNVESLHHKWGIKGSKYTINLIVEDSVSHDNWGEHGIYLGAYGGEHSENIIIRRNLLYKNTRSGFYHNGPATNIVVEENIIHSTSAPSISLYNGISNSFIRNNLIFNNNKAAIMFYNYCADLGSSCNYITPGNSINNLIENNIIWLGNRAVNGESDRGTEKSAIVFNDGCNQGNPAQYCYPNQQSPSWCCPGDWSRNFSNNIIRNNIFYTYDGPIFLSVPLMLIKEQDISKNIFYKRATGSYANKWNICASDTDGTHLGTYSSYYCWNQSQLEAWTGNTGENNFADPLFSYFSYNDYDTQENFDFSLKAGSPAINFGIVNLLTTDLRGILRDSLPDAGCYEYASGAPPVVIYGDVSGNGEISAADASLAAQYAVGLITLTPEQVKKADVSGNGEVSAADASLIAQRAVGLIDKFPVEQ